MAKYVGKRIVPKHCGYWDAANEYEMESIVYHKASGNSYISRKTVPAGTDISQTDYWALCSDFNEQLYMLDQHVTESEAAIKADNDATEAAIKADNDATEAAIKQDNDATETAIKEDNTNTALKIKSHNEATARAVIEDNASTKQHVDTSLEETTATLTKKVTEAQSAMTEQKAAFDKSEKALNARMDSIAKGVTTDTEILDARVDSNGNAYETLGSSIRRTDAFLARVPKIPLAITNSSIKSEQGTGSTMTLEKIENGSAFSGIGINLTMNNEESDPKHFIRGYVRIPQAEFDEKYNGRKMLVQMWSSAEIEIYWAYGFWGAFNSKYTIMQWQTLKEGYNEFMVDTSSEAYQAKERGDDDFYLNFLFGGYNGHTVPADGMYTFRLSMFVYEDMGYGLTGESGAPEAFFSAHSLYAGHSEEADHASEADHAVDADNAVNAQYAVDTKRAGVVNTVQRAIAAQNGNASFVVFNQDTGVVDLCITADFKLATDSGFTMKLGTMSELKGSTLIIKKEEALPFGRYALNAGHSWGNYSYIDVKLAPLYDDYYTLDFDTTFAKMVEKLASVTEDFDGEFWMMAYGNAEWTLPEEGAELHNYYTVFKIDNESFLYSPLIHKIKETVDTDEARIDKLEETIPTEETIKALQERCTELETAAEALKSANVLWGKKYFATGDSFTEGDFSGWTDENGLSGKNSPVIYDTEWKMYKTYPWWIARRNNMTLINDGKCGSIMPLSKEYINGDEGIAESYRNPFALTRYKNIPADVDYITLWFGINDSGHTNLGTVSDTTNETYYGAWNVVMEYLLTNYPYAKIGIIITDGAATTYRQATRDIAKRWGIPYLDMMGSDQVPLIFGRETEIGLCSKANTLRRNAFYVTSSNGHPNLEAHKYQSTFVEDFLRRL